MPRFKHGERVQLVGDIARFYACMVGVVVKGSTYPSAILNQYTVRLADGTVAAFFDFQLETPAAMSAQIIFDSAKPHKTAGTRGAATARNLRLIARGIDIHLKISGGAKKTIAGQVIAGPSAMRNALVTVSVLDQTVDSASTDDSGEFTVGDIPPGDITIEVLIPSRRIVAAITV
jgi:voltage-gated potassium channel Kch